MPTFQQIKDVLALFAHNIWDFLHPFIDMFLSQTGQAVAAIAMDTVAKIALDPSLVTSSDKREAALKDIMAAATAKGLQITETIAMNALQAAVTRLKTSTP